MNTITIPKVIYCEFHPVHVDINCGYKIISTFGIFDEKLKLFLIEKSDGI